LWEKNKLLQQNRPSNVQYVGKNGVAAYHDMGKSGKPPVENSLGEGTDRSHWKESVFGDEIMTGVLSLTQKNFLSALTIRSFADLGYSAVDVSQADVQSTGDRPSKNNEHLDSSETQNSTFFRVGNDVRSGVSGHCASISRIRDLSIAKRLLTVEHKKIVTDMASASTDIQNGQSTKRTMLRQRS
jgi:hypothetical protein